MATVRYELEIHRYWTQSEDWTALAHMITPVDDPATPSVNESLLPLISSNGSSRLVIGTLTNWLVGDGLIYGPHTQQTKQGQKRTYTNGVLTATEDFTLDPGDSLQVGPVAVDLGNSERFGMTARFVEEADPANWYYEPLPASVTGNGVNLLFWVEGTV